MLHFIGAKDAYIAGQFAMRAAWLGLKGGIGGLAVALPTLVALHFAIGSLNVGLLPALNLSFGQCSDLPSTTWAERPRDGGRGPLQQLPHESCEYERECDGGQQTHLGLLRVVGSEAGSFCSVMEQLVVMCHPDKCCLVQPIVVGGDPYQCGLI